MSKTKNYQEPKIKQQYRRLLLFLSRSHAPESLRRKLLSLFETEEQRYERTMFDNDVEKSIDEVLNHRKQQAKVHAPLDRFVFAVILINAIVIYLQVSGWDALWLSALDVVCTIVFLIEMIIKRTALGFIGYWRNGWNRLDGTLVILSLMGFAAWLLHFVPGNSVNVFFVLRLLRVMKFFRVLHFFPRFSQISVGIKRALRESGAVLASFGVLILTFGLINCCLFGTVSPKYFSTPLDSIYSVFRLFTVEGWYDIPDSIATALPQWKVAIKLYFSVLLLGGGIVCMSLINSVFVDAMAADNNDEVLNKLRDVEAKLDELLKEKNAQK